MPAAHADPHGDGADDEVGSSLGDGAILLGDIDRVLTASADIEHRAPRALIRAWRDDLLLVMESLTYARAILAADVAILRHAGGGAGAPDLIGDLPGVFAAGPAHSSDSEVEGNDPMLSEDLFIRTDQLLSPHRAMASVDLSSPVAVDSALRSIEEQFVTVAERQEEVRIRLQQIRAAIVREYEEGAAPAREQPA